MITEEIGEDRIVKALMKHLKIEDEHTSSFNGLGINVEVDGSEYLILDHDARDEYAKDIILDTIEFFKPEFLSRLTGIDTDAFDGICELKGANKLITAVVNGTCGIDKLIEEATNSDGYGHFISGYDGEEIEFHVNNGWDRKTFYAYRIN